MQGTGRDNKGTGKVPYIRKLITGNAKHFALYSKEMKAIMELRAGIFLSRENFNLCFDNNRKDGILYGEKNR